MAIEIKKKYPKTNRNLVAWKKFHLHWVIMALVFMIGIKYGGFYTTSGKSRTL